jgi:hypothetical protein
MERPNQHRATQKKGDFAVAQAIATFTRLGMDVLFPLTESAAYDIAVDRGQKLYRVQVRFCSGKEVGLRRIHSNSKGYVVKKIKKNAFDWLYVLGQDGKEFLIRDDLSNRSTITPQDRDRIEKVLG